MSEVNMLGPLDIHQYLLEHDVRHEIVRLPRPVASAEQFAEVLRLSPRRCLTTHPFHAATPTGDVLVLVLSPADVVYDTAVLVSALAELMTDQLGAHAELMPAGAELVSSHTDYLAGHVAPLLLPPDVVVVASHELAQLDSAIIYTATGDGGTALGIAARDLLAISHALQLPNVTPTTPSAVVLEPPSRAHSGQQAIDLDAGTRQSQPAMRATAPVARRSRLTAATKQAQPQTAPPAPPPAAPTGRAKTAIATAS